ncbi:MAG: 4'-phosphopantetheinyl transferase superfamily protein [Bacteroidales bacterium]|nr:4'-phosphopantetheinyl transferase superfamily protein [Bacteroidales bacterium]MDD4001175.1 4'-phosphopantetheinyl transferase superfamily protein [Bacteroidales bacterium]MDD4528558.1 4'-phosphopantetheinyl transferase superfamily protein [Bacteroidales bacterium]MDD4829485.1 4'-phosphopantetheinyl transferase superfamily protein [Bacteroidales bacterium]
MEYLIYHIDKAKEQFGEDKTLSTPKQISLWSKQILLEIIKKKGLKFNFTIECTVEGKPFFKFNKELHFSISHTNQYIAIALSNKQIGIDIEQERKYKKNLVERFLHPKEALILSNLSTLKEKDQAFTKIWTIKESYVKCTGTGIANNFKVFYINPFTTPIQIKDNKIPVTIHTYFLKEENLFLSLCQEKEEISQL